MGCEFANSSGKHRYWVVWILMLTISGGFRGGGARGARPLPPLLWPKKEEGRKAGRISKTKLPPLKIYRRCRCNCRLSKWSSSRNTIGEYKSESTGPYLKCWYSFIFSNFHRGFVQQMEKSIKTTISIYCIGSIYSRRGRCGEAKRSEIKTFGAWMKKDEGRGRRNATLIFAMVSRVTAIIYVTFTVILLFEKKNAPMSLVVYRRTIRLATPDKHTNIRGL